MPGQSFDTHLIGCQEQTIAWQEVYEGVEIERHRLVEERKVDGFALRWPEFVGGVVVVTPRNVTVDGCG